MAYSKSNSDVDITYPIKCTIVSWKRVDSHIEYVIEVERLLGDLRKWLVQRRYAEFRKLNDEISKFGLDITFPPKKILGNTKENFIQKRLKSLQTFLDTLCSHLLFCTSSSVVSFLKVIPYTIFDLNEWILVSLRDKNEWIIKRYRENCGWRYDKMYHEVWRGRTPMIMFGIRYGPDRFAATLAELNEALQFLRTLDCTFLRSCASSWATEGGIISIRPIFKDGSLRDHLFKSDWRHHFFAKYCTGRPIHPLKTSDVRFICRQVLEALSLLNALSIPFLDVHAGNVILTDYGCEIIDLDQVLAGQSNFHRSSMLRSSSVNTVEDMIVWSFGEFVYELFTGSFSFPIGTYKEAIEILPPMFQSLLHSIFIENSLPSLRDLLDSSLLLSNKDRKLDLREINASLLNSLFADALVMQPDQREVRIPASTKRILDGLSDSILKRFKNDRAKYSKARKEQKFRKLIDSETEKLRRRQIIILEQLKLKSPVNIEPSEDNQPIAGE